MCAFPVILCLVGLYLLQAYREFAHDSSHHHAWAALCCHLLAGAQNLSYNTVTSLFGNELSCATMSLMLCILSINKVTFYTIKFY